MIIGFFLISLIVKIRAQESKQKTKYIYLFQAKENLKQSKKYSWICFKKQIEIISDKEDLIHLSADFRQKFVYKIEQKDDVMIKELIELKTKFDQVNAEN